MFNLNPQCGNRRAQEVAGALAAVVLSLAGCDSSPRAPAFELATEEWTFDGVVGTRLLSDHFDIRTTVTDEPMVTVLPVFLEACHQEYESLLGPRARGTDPMAVYVFDTRSQWWAFTQRFAPNQAPVYQHITSGGFADQATATGVFYWIGRDRTLAVAAHEGLHQYIARHFESPIPAWLNEGLATQMETFELHDGVPVFVPRRNLFRKNDLMASFVDEHVKLFELPEFLTMHAGHAVVSPTKPTATYYAQAWSLVLFLRQGPNKAWCEGFRRMLADAGTEAMSAAVKAYRVATPDAADMSFGELIFRYYITEDYDAFMNEYTAFARDLACPPTRGTWPF
ncbi:MAG: hypothetical protein JXA69_14700 [Phycisphaerae bacterium]|nr:hypothetical protein [Phycisphaerae bacterium]